MDRFKTHYNASSFPKKPEIGSGERKVETAGYIPVKTRVENMMLAGQNLMQARKEMYDFDGEVDEDFNDPTRQKSFDLADATQINLSLEAKARALKANQAAQGASVEAAKAGGEVTPPPAEEKGQ